MIGIFNKYNYVVSSHFKKNLAEPFPGCIVWPFTMKKVASINFGTDDSREHLLVLKKIERPMLKQA